MMVYSVSTLSRTGCINIGYATETGVTQIGFDCSTWLERWPDMTIEVWVTAPGAASAYEAKARRKGDVIVWEVLQSDTQTPGAGRVELIGYTADKRKLSASVNTRIDDSMLMAEGTEPPEAQQPWYTAAQEAKARAEAIARNAPIIENGVWMLWDPDKGEYVSSGVQAQGPKGDAAEGGGLPEGAGPWMQLVTGADGVSRWEPRLAYAETEEVVILPETALNTEGAGEVAGSTLFTIYEPLSETLVPDMEYTVIYNGAKYECIAKVIAADGMSAVVLGNIEPVFGGEDTGEPFVFIPMPEEYAGLEGMGYAQVTDFDGSESVTISITGVAEKVKTIDPDKMGKNAGANKVLVTDENGEAVWSDGLADGSGGGGGGILYITAQAVPSSSDLDVIDQIQNPSHTYADVKAAVDAGRICVLKLEYPDGTLWYMHLAGEMPGGEDSAQYAFVTPFPAIQIAAVANAAGWMIVPLE